MAKFIITTDSSCDCAIDELKQKDIPVVFFEYADGTKTLVDDMNEKNYKSFYENMRKGIVYKTSQINPQRFYDFFKDLVKLNLPIIHMSLGSGLSNTVNSVHIAINMLKEDFPNCDIKVIDSKIASLGLTVMLNKLVELRDNDVEADKAFEIVNSKVINTIAYYTTDTLTYFARGGRLSKVEAFLGNALKINPILDCTPAGTLRIVDKVRGSKKAIEQLINRVKDVVIDPSNQYVLVCHADDEERGHLVGQKLVDEVGFKGYKLYFMGPIIGAHTGPGLVAVFFEGKTRTEEIKSLSKSSAEDINEEINKNLK